MLTRLVVRNFKRFGEVEIELGDTVVFIGPNNAGKSTALQALALWDLGLRRWTERRAGKATPEKRPGVTINRRDLVTVPVPTANLLWKDLHVRDTRRTIGKSETKNVRIEILVEGVDDGQLWQCGFEFDFANDESFYCRPLHGPDGERMPVPTAAGHTRVALLPPMSGLSAREDRFELGSINLRLGEGRTAEVLRNLCYQVVSTDRPSWDRLREQIHQLFHIQLDEPEFLAESGLIQLSYREANKVRLDLSSSGRGLQQTLLLLAYLALNPGSILLIDEPDAHLEILRQRQIYQILTEAARSSASQLIMASHSEVILNEAADRDVVVAFVGRPHRIDDRGSQALKALKEIGYHDYYQAEQTGWVLYLEGSTDLAILRQFAETLQHAGRAALERPFVHYVLNQPGRARDHFFGLRAARPDLAGFALFDALSFDLDPNPHLAQHAWQRREIESYFTRRDVLLRWAAKEFLSAPLLVRLFEQTLDELENALWVLGRSPWSGEIKVTDDFLDPLFERFYQRAGLASLLRKTDYHVLARFVRADELDSEVTAVLDVLAATAAKARPALES